MCMIVRDKTYIYVYDYLPELGKMGSYTLW